LLPEGAGGSAESARPQERMVSANNIRSGKLCVTNRFTGHLLDGIFGEKGQLEMKYLIGVF
jgi:hypothetical protein